MPCRRPSAVVLRHVAFEDLGLLAPILHEAGWSASYCEASTQDLSDQSIEQADLLIALGGPIGVYETERFPFLLKEIAVLERRLAKDRPTLGICLGGQLMARALGSRVFPGLVRNRLGASRADGRRPSIELECACRAARGRPSLAWGHLRSPRRSGQARVERRLRKSGLCIRRTRPGFAVSRRGRSAAVGRPSVMRWNCRLRTCRFPICERQPQLSPVNCASRPHASSINGCRT
jgi:Glutamine amidotransferase class-I